MKKLMTLVFCLTGFMRADIGHGILEKYKKGNVFICTSFQNGLNIYKATQANFSKIYFIENDKVLFDHSKFILDAYLGKTPHLNKINKFNDIPTNILPKFIYNINESITFLLNTHLPELDNPSKYNPIIDEINIIKTHPIKNHLIIIDHINWAGTIYFGNVALNAVKGAILQINPRYKFVFAKGGHLENQENAALIAYID